jgi:hypothetical protein
MKITVQVVIDPEDGTTTPTIHEAGVIERGDLTPATAGLHLDEAHQILSTIQPAPAHRPGRHGAHHRRRLLALRAHPRPQGQSHDRAAHPVRHAAPAQPAFHSLPLQYR